MVRWRQPTCSQQNYVTVVSYLLGVHVLLRLSLTDACSDKKREILIDCSSTDRLRKPAIDVRPLIKQGEETSIEEIQLQLNFLKCNIQCIVRSSTYLHMATQKSVQATFTIHQFNLLFGERTRFSKVAKSNS